MKKQKRPVDIVVISDVHLGTYGLQDGLAATRVDALLNRMFIEPLLGNGYPIEDLKLLLRLEPFIKDGDESKLAFDMDFFGVQNYTREIIAYSYFTPLLRAKIIRANKRNVDTTLMNWEVYPECIYNMLHRFNSYKNIKELIVTENGAAFNDVLMNDSVAYTFNANEFICLTSSASTSIIVFLCR